MIGPDQIRLKLEVAARSYSGATQEAGQSEAASAEADRERRGCYVIIVPLTPRHQIRANYTGCQS